MRPKGVSPVIASIILVLIAIASGAAFLTFTGRLAGQSQAAGEEQTVRAVELTATTFTIGSVKDQRIFVTNTGGADIGTNSLDVRIDDTRVNYTQDETIEKGGSGTITLAGLWRFGLGEHTLKVSGAAYSVTKQIRIVPADGRVLDLRFEEGSGTVANDLSGNGNTGTLTNEPAWTKSTPSRSSQNALGFDGNNDYVSIPDSQLFNITSIDFTIEGWAYVPAVGANGYAISKGESGYSPPATSMWYVYVTENGPSLSRRAFGAGSDESIAGPTVLHGIVGKWFHFSISRQGSTYTLYQNGVTTGTASTANAPYSNTQPLWIGARKHAGTTYAFEGTLDEIRIYNRAYTPEQLYVMEEV
ncbi:MAG: hypothetical protein HYS81_00700 [Candidatus Aenigmatarchaeota archaeon]|nr:MAG: hypothetical protein HYS81_00700 [Candidatus Aenigmarchaeota archaeon]